MRDNQVAVVGSFVQDLSFAVETFPAAGETRIGTFRSGPGGKGSNQAVAAHRQGIPTRFIGAVGRDILGEGYQEWAREQGLPVSLMSTDAPTGAASILVNQSAENQIVVALGANEKLDRDYVLSELEKQSSLAVLLLQAESNLDATAAALLYARQKGVFSILNPAPINPGVSTEFLISASCITPNETEAAYLIEKVTGRRFNEDLTRMSDSAIREVCECLPVSTIIITLGKSGSLLYQRREPHAMLRGVTKGEVFRAESIPVQPVDTTGAGDAFNGGFAAGLVRFEGDIRRAVRYANAVAGLSTTKEGTAPAMPTREEVEAFRASFE